SLSNCQKHLTALLDALDLYRKEFKIEGALFTLHEMDLQEELAYRCVLFGAIPSIEFAICRKERSCSPDALWRKKRSLYKQLHERVESLLETFQRAG
ncbi:MAG TPA: hypothetical protein PLO43_01575, partial [Chlamydiales bacterium]|nr:hypothetical protein [Chlamydiales bacterium]